MPSTGVQIGSGTVGGTGGLPQIQYGHDDSNTGGVINGSAAADQTAAAAVTTGLEFSFDLAALSVAGDFKFMAGVNGSNHDFWSNQFLPGLTPPQANLGSDGLGNFVAPGTVGAVNFETQVPGLQYVTLTAPVTTYNWNLATGGDWNTAANWSGGLIPDSAAVKVTLGSTIAAPATVSISTGVIVAGLTFDSPNAYTVAGPGTLSINGSSATTAVSVLQGNHTISAPVALAGNTRFDVSAASSLVLSGPFTATGRNVFKQGAGSLTIPAGPANSFTVNAGTLRLTGAGNSVVKGVTIDPDATLDLGSSTLIVDYDEGFSPLADVKAHVAAARLLSSTIAGASRAIGYLDTAFLPSVTSFGVDPLDPTALVIRATVKGDANLDRSVDFPDLLALAQNYGSVTGEWYTGDFDANGIVEFPDLLALAQNYGGSVTGSFDGDWALAQSMVPEPTSLAILGLAGGALMGRRRRA